MRLLVLVLFFCFTLFANEKVVLQLDWKHQFQFAGFYVAKELGYYQKAGLDVIIKEYNNSIDVVEDVIAKEGRYGLGKSSLLIERSHGKPIVVLSAIFQKSPSVLITVDKNITSAADLKHKRIMITSNEVTSAPIMTMLQSNGLTSKDFTILKHSFNYKDLLNGKTDAMACYLSNEPYFLEQNKSYFKVFDPQDYGYDFFGDLLFTSEKEIQLHPQRVKAFNEATKQGWIWAFKHISKAAELIHLKYNSQHKPLEALEYEGKVLKKLAFSKDEPFFHISTQKFEKIAQIYKLFGLIKVFQLKGFIDPLRLNTQTVRIGVLSKRGDETTHRRWDKLTTYLNANLEAYNFQIIPLGFHDLEESVKNKEIDFVVANDMYYVLLEHQYGVSRIATLVNDDGKNNYNLNEFGGVIFTRKDNKKINSLKDIVGNSFAAVNKRSFGGWIMAYEEFEKEGVDKEDIKVTFLNTHDAVVKGVLDKRFDAGTVRTDTLEHMVKEGKINLKDIKILNEKKYENFPYFVSTKLYPEWPFAKLRTTSNKIASKVLSELVNIDLKKEPELKNIGSWSVPADYSSVEALMKKLRVEPYDKVEILLRDVFKKYIEYILATFFLIVILIVRYVYVKRLNDNLQDYNKRLHVEVEKQTHALNEANKHLKILAQTDSLTGVNNRAFFMKIGKKYFNIAKRNGSNLQVLMLDLDHFKRINDTYGHQAGDRVLIEFTKTINLLLRESDLLGRIGGEEFCLIMQNSSTEGAIKLAKRICGNIEAGDILFNNQIIKITVSIGIASLEQENNLSELINKSDIALYEAKAQGRNRAVVFKP